MFTNKNYHQGDTQFFGVNEVPKGAKKIEKRYVAESERSGSAHALFGNYDMYEAEGGQLVIDAKEECILNHSLKTLLEGTGVSLDKPAITDKKDHRHTVLPKGVYFVGIQNKFDPLSGLKKRVLD
jgi:hypothetical protein